MAKAPVSVTLDRDNLLWLRSQAASSKRRSLSDALDQIVTQARMGRHGAAVRSRSVVGTVDISRTDPGLDEADAHVQAVYATSLGRPLLLREYAPRPPGVKARRRTRRRG